MYKLHSLLLYNRGDLLKYYGIIYSATNKINNKKYIGQTTCSLMKRKREHLTSVTQNKTSFQKAINKYGIKNFVWKIIDHAESQEELDEKEIYWIDYYNTFGHDGYNMTTGGQGVNRAIGERRIEYLQKFCDNYPFLIFDKHGNFIKECDNRLLFCTENNIPTNDARIVLRNKKPSVKDYILIYKEDFTEENLKQRINKTRNNREFVVFDENNQYKGTWINQSRCGEDLGVHRNYISKCLLGILNKSHGFYFYYKDDCPEELKFLCA